MARVYAQVSRAHVSRGRSSNRFRKTSQDAKKGPEARRRPTAAREAYFLYVERAAEGANEADGPFSAACLCPEGRQHPLRKQLHLPESIRVVRGQEAQDEIAHPG